MVKTTLFLVGGLIEHAGGSSRLARLGGMVRTAPVIAVLFVLPALSLAGIPPFSGFVAKFGLFDATSRSSQWAILAVAVVVSLLTLFSLVKIWIAVFWSGRDETDPSPHPGHGRPPWLMLAPTAVLAALTLAIGVAAGPLYDLADRAAVDLLDPTAYRQAVLGTVRSARVRDRPGRDLGPAVGLGVAGQRAVGAGDRGGPRRARARLAPCRTVPSTFRPLAVARLVGYMLVNIVRSNVELTARCWPAGPGCTRPSSACRSPTAPTSC